MDTMIIQKETYQTLKWVSQFAGGGMSISPQYDVVHIIGGSLVATTGLILGRVDIPEDIKEYCKRKKYFNITKLTTNPYLLIAEHKGLLTKEQSEMIQNGASNIIESTKEVTVPEHFYTRLKAGNIKTLATVPGADRIDFYSKDPHEMTVAVTSDVTAILMPLTSNIKPDVEEESKEKEQEK